MMYGTGMILFIDSCAENSTAIFSSANLPIFRRINSFRSPLRKYGLSLLLFACITCFATAQDTGTGEPEKAEKLQDPGLVIAAPQLTAEQAKTCRKFFSQLSSPDYDVREQALNQIVAFGTAALPLAAEFSKDPDPEVSGQSRAMKERILFSFDGYLPTEPALHDSLIKPIVIKVTQGDKLSSLLNTTFKPAGIPYLVDPQLGDPQVLVPQVENWDGPAAECMGRLLQYQGLKIVPRGNTCLITSANTAQKLSIQRHTFDWSELGLSRVEAESLSKALQPFFTAVTTEIHSGSEVFTLRGEEACFPRAARLIALLKPGSADSVWPAQPEQPANLLDRLSATDSLALMSEDPLDAIVLLKKHVLYVVSKDGKAIKEPPFPPDLGGISPVRLSLHEMPLGLLMRWLERRSKISAAEQANLKLAYDIAAGSRIQFELQPKEARVLDWPVCGADVTFLYPRGAKPGEASDAAARTLLWNALDSHLALFPSILPSRDLTVVRGRMLMQGPPATLARALELVREWRAKKEAPRPAAWRAALDARLAAEIDWNGKGMSGGRVIPALRQLGHIDILLEENADGSPPDFKLTAEDAELLPPGKHALKELLDDLCKKAGGNWSVELSAVVLTALPEKKNSNNKN